MSGIFKATHKKLFEKSQDLDNKLNALPEGSISPELFEELRSQAEAMQLACEELQIQNDELTTSNELVLDQETTYKKLFELTPVAFITTDLTTKLKTLNAAAASLLGVDRQFLGNRPLAVFIHSKRRPYFYSILERLKNETIEEFQWETEIKTRSQKIESVIVNAFRTHETSELHWSIYNISHRIAKERQNRLEQTEDFLASLLHDLKVPLVGTGMVLNSLCKDEDVEEKTEEGEILSLLKKTNELSIDKINNLLYAYKLSAATDVEGSDRDSIEKEKVRFELNELLDDCKNILEPMAFACKITIELSVEKTISIVACKPQIERMLVCLLDNAVKYSPDNATILLKAFVDADELVLVCEDNGPGITEQDKTKLFKRFWRGQTENSPRSSGLGLFLCYQIVELHGGNICCESEPSKGTKFIVKFPAESVSLIEKSFN